MSTNNSCNSQIEKVYTINDDVNKLTIIKFKEYGVESESVTLKFVPQAQESRSLMDVSDLTLKACFRPGKETYEISIHIFPLWYFYLQCFIHSHTFVNLNTLIPHSTFYSNVQNKDTSTEYELCPCRSLNSRFFVHF